MVTIKEVAARAKVSVGTVSNVLGGLVPVSDKLRARVMRAVASLDYHPNHIARSLKTRQTMMLGMVISDITNPFFPLMVRGAEDAALERGYLLVTFNTDDDVEREKHVLSVLRTRRMDGILLVVAPNTGDITHIRNMVDAGIPIVCLDRIPQRIKVSSVSVDAREGAADCVRHLIALGHRRVAIITGTPGLQTARERLAGYEQALAKARIKPDPRLIAEGDFRQETGYRLTRELWQGEARPTALFVSNGMMGLGALQAIRELGIRCPEDLALAVFDELPGAAALSPTVTSVRQPAHEMGRCGAELLIEQIEGKMKGAQPTHVLLKAELKVRESTAGRGVR